MERHPPYPEQWRTPADHSRGQARPQWWSQNSWAGWEGPAPSEEQFQISDWWHREYDNWMDDWWRSSRGWSEPEEHQPKRARITPSDTSIAVAVDTATAVAVAPDALPWPPNVAPPPAARLGDIVPNPPAVAPISKGPPPGSDIATRPPPTLPCLIPPQNQGIPSAPKRQPPEVPCGIRDQSPSPAPNQYMLQGKAHAPKFPQRPAAPPLPWNAGSAAVAAANAPPDEIQIAEDHAALEEPPQVVEDMAPRGSTDPLWPTVVVHGVYDLNYFRRYTRFRDSYKQHNAALKYFRGQLEDTSDPQNSNEIPLMHDTNHIIPKIIHLTGERSQEWEWDETTLVAWNWKELVAQLDDESMELVVNGPQGHSGGLVGMGFMLRPRSYDHSRQEQLPKGSVMQPGWEFVAHRYDGSGIRLHPRWSHTKFQAYDMDTHDVQVQPPRRGKGKSDGKGTYRKYLQLGVLKQLRFDANKRPRYYHF